MYATVTSHARTPASEPGAAFVYLLIGLGTSIAAWFAWPFAVTLTICATPLGLRRQAAAVSARVLRRAADLDRVNAGAVLGVDLPASYRTATGDLRAQGSVALGDPQTRRDLVWSMLQSVVGSAFGCAAVSAVVSLAGMATVPLWYRAVPNPDFIGLWHSNTLPRALAVTAVAVPAALITAWLVRLMAETHVRMAARWLTPSPN